MKQHMVRLSFDIPEEEHTMLKMTCVQAKVAIKDFVHEMILDTLRSKEKIKI